MATYHVTSISYLVNGHVEFNFLQMQARLQAQQVRCVVRFVQLPVQFIISFIKPALKNKKAKSSFTLRQLEPAANTWKKIIQSLRFKKTEDSEFFFASGPKAFINLRAFSWEVRYVQTILKVSQVHSRTLSFISPFAKELENLLFLKALWLDNLNANTNYKMNA